jgi:glucose-6-phosphate isomerase
MHDTESIEPVNPFSVELDLETGLLLNASCRLVRRASDMRGHYADAAALEAMIAAGNPTHYEVFEVPVPRTGGHLMCCISRLQPGRVGDEFFMTKGHYHKVAETAEIYICLRGEGYMLMRTAGGRWDARKMTRGRMVYVSPFWAHRSVNTGHEPLISFCVWPAQAGHNYGDIQTQGFPRRIVDRNGQVAIVEAPEP